MSKKTWKSWKLNLKSTSFYEQIFILYFLSSITWLKFKYMAPTPNFKILFMNLCQILQKNHDYLSKYYANCCEILCYSGLVWIFTFMVILQGLTSREGSRRGFIASLIKVSIGQITIWHPLEFLLSAWTVGCFTPICS